MHHFRNIQEREEWEYQWGAQDEMKNAYAISMMNRPQDDPKVWQLKEAGRVVVFNWVEQYCQSTDALLPSTRHYMADFDTVEQADQYIQRFYLEHGNDEYYNLGCTSNLPSSEPVREPTPDDEIPF